MKKSPSDFSGLFYVCKSCLRKCGRQPRQIVGLTRRGLTSAVVARRTPTESALQDHVSSGLSRAKRPLKISPESLALRWTNIPHPTPTNLASADRFFNLHPPEYLWSAPKLATMEFGNADVPEVAFLGRSNVGKSSLLNALLGRKISNTSSKPGRTRSMNAFSVHQGKLIILDMPGYGKGSREEWGKEILKYLSARKQLRRTFLLIDALHGIKDSDKQLLAILRQESVAHQIILSKVDKVLFPNSRRVPSDNALEYRFSLLRRSMEEVRQIIDARDGGKSSAVGEILACSAERIMEKSRKLGIDSVRWTVLAAARLTGGKNMMPQQRTSDFFKDDGSLD